MRTYKFLFIILMVGIFLSTSSCIEYDEKRELKEISKLSEMRPDSALHLLQKYKLERNFGSTSEKMYYDLVVLKAQNKAGATFNSDSIQQILVKYFTTYGSNNAKVLSYYLLGRAHYDLGESPLALQDYYNAIEIADTTQKDCNYNTLMGVYGQMAGIFNEQNLPEDEIWALNKYVKIINKLYDKSERIVARYQLTRPYYLLGDKKKVLNIILQCYKELLSIDRYKMAAGILPPAISIYIDEGQTLKAKKYIDFFNRYSEYVDKDGNAIPGHEHYYVTLGSYYLEINKNDSAEYYYRKAIPFGFGSESYRGLLAIYRQKNNLDSVVRFSYLYEDAIDSLHNKIQIESIHKMSALYNYTRSQRIAEQEAKKSRTAKGIIAIILFGVVVGIFVVWYVYKKNKDKKVLELQALQLKLCNAKSDYLAAEDELKRLKDHDYESLILEKERRIEELQLEIDALSKENSRSIKNDDLEGLSNSNIVSIFHKKEIYKAGKTLPTSVEWSMLERQFSEYMPLLCDFMTKVNILSKLELRTCILIVLDFSDSSIVTLTNSSSQTISKAKSRANEKLFHERSARTLKANLLMHK